VYDLVTVRLADRPQPVMVAPDTPWLRQAVADGLLIVLDPPARQPGRARAHKSSRRSGPRMY
jgi:hypothetical protein